jgi:hypothetical protein
VAADRQHIVVAQGFTSALEDALQHLAGADGNAPSDPTTPLYIRGSNPLEAIRAPDGHQVTLSEWRAVSGQAHLQRKINGSEVKLDVTGLIPDGTYTAWVDYFVNPAFNFSSLAPNYAQSKGTGALGINNATQNLLQVNALGEASLTVTHPAGPLSAGNPPLQAPLWALDGFDNFVVTVVYHNDGQTYGGTRGPHSVASTFAGFAVPEPSSAALGLLSVACFAVFRRRPLRAIA